MANASEAEPRTRHRLLLAAALAGLVATLSAQTVRTPRVVEPAVSEPRVDPVRDPARPAVFIVGDSAKDHGPGEGWGDFLAPFFDERRIQILNWALEGAGAAASSKSAAGPLRSRSCAPATAS